MHEPDGGDFVEARPGEPFDMLLDPSLHAAALAFEASLRAGEDVKPADVAGLNIQSWVVSKVPKLNTTRQLERLDTA